MIYITGDTYLSFSGSKQILPQQTQMGRNDYMIICGDLRRAVGRRKRKTSIGWTG